MCKDSSNEKCEYCENEHLGEYGSGRFCNSTCARGFSTKLKRKETSRKVSKTLKIKHVEPWNKKKSAKLTFSKITGEICNKEKPNKSFWIKSSKSRFTEKLCKWFNISMGKFPDTIQQLEILRERISVLYEDKGFSSIEIKNHLNIPLPNGHMPAFLKQLNIKRKTLCEARLNYIKKYGITIPRCGKNYKYKYGWHIAWDKTKQYYRSSYELNFYKFLDNKKISYISEGIRIRYFDSVQNKMRIAIPDILMNNIIIEIKSDYHYNKQEMMDKFKAYNKSGFKALLLLEGKFYRYLK